MHEIALATIWLWNVYEYIMFIFTWVPSGPITVGVVGGSLWWSALIVSVCSVFSNLRHLIPLWGGILPNRFFLWFRHLTSILIILLGVGSGHSGSDISSLWDLWLKTIFSLVCRQYLVDAAGLWTKYVLVNPKQDQTIWSAGIWHFLKFCKC